MCYNFNVTKSTIKIKRSPFRNNARAAPGRKLFLCAISRPIHIYGDLMTAPLKFAPHPDKRDCIDLIYRSRLNLLLLSRESLMARQRRLIVGVS